MRDFKMIDRMTVPLLLRRSVFSALTLTVAAVFGVGPASAQDLNCASPTNQIEMTGCAAQAHKAADGDLNLAWSLASARAKSLDAAVPGLEPSYFDILLDAQRAWIPFRDKACEAESTLARGGSMQNMLFFICLERLTRQRTEDLRFYGEVN